LNGDDYLFLLRLVRFLLGEILKLAVINDFTNRRLSVRSDLNQIHAPFARGANCIARVHDPELFPVFRNHAHLGHADSLVNSSYRRAAKIGTAAASKTCSYCCTSSVKSFEFRVLKFQVMANLKLETWNLK